MSFVYEMCIGNAAFAACTTENYKISVDTQEIPKPRTLPKAPKEEEMRNKQWLNKLQTWNRRRTKKEDLQRRNHLGTVSRKTTGVCVGGGGGGYLN